MTTPQNPKASAIRAVSLPPVMRAALAQLFAWMLMNALPPANALVQGEPAWIAQGAIAAAIGSVFGLSWWWLPINTAAVSVVMLMQSIDIAPHWYLALFAVSALVYWSTFSTQVPLYLSNRNTCAAITQLLPRGKQFRFLDVGCGVGTVLSFLAPRTLNGKFHGVEVAPLPYVIAMLRAIVGQYQVARRSLWSMNFGDYDVVYAYLSPVPMSELWRKAKREMRPGSVLISNTFSIEEAAPHLTVHVGPGHRQLFVWRF